MNSSALPGSVYPYNPLIACNTRAYNVIHDLISTPRLYLSLQSLQGYAHYLCYMRCVFSKSVFLCSRIVSALKSVDCQTTKINVMNKSRNSRHHMIYDAPGRYIQPLRLLQLVTSCMSYTQLTLYITLYMMFMGSIYNYYVLYDLPHPP